MAAKDTLRLKVASAQQQDVGKGIVRIGPKQIKGLGIQRGDVIERKSPRTPIPLSHSFQNHFQR